VSDVSEDPTSADAVARSMGLGGDRPPERAPEAREAAVTVTAADAGARSRTGLGAGGELAWWRQGKARAVIVGVALTFAGYVFSWGDVEDDSRVLAAVAGGLSFLWLTTIVGSAWWAIRLVVSGRRPYGRTAFNYGLVSFMVLFGVLGADELLG
jgi:hypothetical protein